MAGGSHVGSQAKLLGNTGFCQQGATMQSDSRCIVGIGGPYGGQVGCVCFDIRGEIEQVERDPGKMANPVTVR